VALTQVFGIGGMSSQRTVLFGTAAICAAGLLGYAIYFDYKRRNDLEFRKELRREQKKVSSKKTRDKLAQPVQAALENEDLRAALAKIKSEPLPSSQIEREHYLMTQLGEGERLALQGPAYRLEAALCFYRALRTAPGSASVNFFQVIESTQPPEVFKILMELVSLDVSPPSSSGRRGDSTPPMFEEVTSSSSANSPSRSPPQSESDWEKLADSSIPTSSQNSIL